MNLLDLTPEQLKRYITLELKADKAKHNKTAKPVNKASASRKSLGFG